MILNTFTRKDRRNWYVQFSDPETGRRRVWSTAVRKSEPDAKLKLTKIKLGLQEKYLAARGGLAGQEQHGWGWVAGWIAERYHGKEASLVKRRNQWNYLAAFFDQHHLHGPLHLRREHAMVYIVWRGAQLKEKSKRGAGRNTALDELHFAGTILREAIARNMIVTNAWEKLGFERKSSRVRPEFTDPEIARIRQKLLGEPEWMRVSFEIALHTGLRFAETRIALENVDLRERRMLVAKPKGGPRRAYTVPIPEALQGILQALHRKGRAHTWIFQATGNRPLPGLSWSRFFRELDLGVGYCFHCTRVTFISRGARAGLPEHVMMQLVNHASREVHQIYRRVTVGDAAQFVDLVPIPALRSAGTARSRSRRR